MQHIKLFVILSFFLASFSAQGQVPIRGFCGSVLDEPGIATLKENVRKAENPNIEMRSGITRYVPVTFHFIAEDNGNGYPREEQALEQLASINELYSTLEFVFYIDQILYKADSRIYNAPASGSSVFQMRLIKDKNSMNIYVTKTAESGSGTPGVVLGYYSGSEDWIVIRKDEFSGGTGTLGHEIGHFFSLAHPYSFWECEPYDEEIHGNPVSSIWSPCNGSVRVELQDGSNCNDSGDFICDTPPDYMFGFGWSVGGDQCAVYNAGTMDPSGEIVDPMETNVMGAFIGCDMYEFTNTQQNVVRSDFQSPRRSYLRTGVVPKTTPVVDDVVYNSPINGESSPTFNQVAFDWDDVAGANQYLFIIDRFSSFTSAPERTIVDGSDIVIPELTQGVRYFWKVWPFNESQTGAGWSETQSFIVGTISAVNEISSVEDFNIFPNPVTDGKLIVDIRSTESFEAEIRLVDLSGKILQLTNGHQIQANSPWNVELNTQSLSTGLYIVQVVTEKGILTSKFAVQ